MPKYMQIDVYHTLYQWTTPHTEPASQTKKRAQDGPDWRRHCARDTDDEQVSDQEELTTDR